MCGSSLEKLEFIRILQILQGGKACLHILICSLTSQPRARSRYSSERKSTTFTPANNWPVPTVAIGMGITVTVWNDILDCAADRFWYRPKMWAYHSFWLRWVRFSVIKLAPLEPELRSNLLLVRFNPIREASSVDCTKSIKVQLSRDSLRLFIPIIVFLMYVILLIIPWKWLWHSTASSRRFIRLCW